MFEYNPQQPDKKPPWQEHFMTHARIRASGWDPLSPKELREYLRIQRMSVSEVEKHFTLFMRNVGFTTP